MSTEPGTPVVVDVQELLEERVSILEAENHSLRSQVSVMAVELNMVANWIRQNGGVDLFNQESEVTEVYKNCHPKGEKSAEIEKELAVVLISAPAQPVGLLASKFEPGLDKFEEATSVSEQSEESRPAAAEGNQMQMEDEEMDSVRGTIAIKPDWDIMDYKEGVLLGSPSLSLPMDDQPIDRIPLNTSISKIAMDVIRGKIVQRPASSPSSSKRRNYACNLCPSTFHWPSDLKRHMLTHSKERPHICPLCDARFRQIDVLTRHIRTMHTKDRPHKCSVCAERFSRLDYLKRHQHVHVHNGDTGTGSFKV